jgi:catechol 2,3-dioxygenase-like lactoylglutathione lyase family enzyme
MKTKLMHVRVNVSNLDKSIKWYEDILGFELDSLYPPNNPCYADFKEACGATFAIMVDKSPSSGRLNFDVEDVDALWKSLKEKVDIAEELYDTPYGTRKFTIKDLDGNELGFVQEC